MAARLEEVANKLADIADPRELLEGLFAFSPVGFQLYRTDGQCLLTNRAFRDLFGSEPPPEYNVLRDEIAERNGVLELIHRAFAGETITTPPIWYDPRELKQVKVVEGRRCAITSTFFPLHDRSGDVAYVAIVFRDVTEELRAQEEAEARRRDAERAADRLRFIADATEALSASLDVEQTAASLASRVVPAVADLCTLMLVEEGNVRRLAHGDVGVDTKKLDFIRSLPFPESVRERLVAVMSSREPLLLPDFTRWVTELAGPDDPYVRGVSEIGVRSTVLAPVLARGRGIGVLAVSAARATGRVLGPEEASLVRDLGRHVGLALANALLFEESQRAKASAEAANRAKDDFLAMLGHELRNPLAPILTALQLLRLKGEPSFTRERTIIERQVEHMVRLVDDLLDVSRITRGKLTLRKAPVEVALVVAKAIEMVSPLLEQKSHRLVTRMSPTGLVVLADEGRLAQVFANLLTNAAKYTPPGGTITVSAKAVGEHVQTSISDTGSGINSELLPQIFDRFVQGSRALDRSEGGLGLGLAIVRSLDKRARFRDVAKSRHALPLRAGW